MITDDKLIFHYDSIKNKQPVTADIFLTNYCNNNCKYCTYKRWKLERNSKSLSFEEFIRNAKILIDNGVKGFILTGGGEPCLCEDFDKITGWLEENNIQYGINTNFNILKLIKPVFLKVSLDCYDEESYFYTRGVRKYGTVIDNINKYIEWKKTNNVTTKVVLQCVADSIEKVDLFYEAVKSLDIQNIVFRPIESTDGNYYSTTELKSEAENIVKHIKHLQNKDSRVSANYKFNYLDIHFEDCHANSLQIAVNEYSEVIYCCQKPYEIIGKLTDSDIFKKRLNHKTDMKTCDIPCRLSGPNNCILKLNAPIDVNFI